MKVNFYIHSKTGNSLSVANSLSEVAKSTQHETMVTQITPNDEDQMNLSLITINTLPDPIDADLIVLGGPVHAFSASPSLLKAISSMENLQGKRCILYVTQSLPFDWMGGTRSIRQLEKLLSQEGVSVLCKSIIHWNKPDRDAQINRFIDKFKLIIDGKTI